jgi:protocatechuate 3,4-dioxygenase beta subunit
MPAEWVVQREAVAKGSTDEDGRYKLTNVPPGRYQLTAVSPGYVFAEPNANEWQPGKVVNVAAGGESDEVDITLAKLARAYKARGRVVDEDGRAVSGVDVTYISMTADSQRFRGNMFGAGKTDERGEFTVRGLTPGGWGVWASSGEYSGDSTQGTTYSNPAIFEVADSDVSGLEIKMRRGAEVSGVINIEGTSDPAVLARFREARFGAWVNTDAADTGVPNYASFKPGTDGSFHITGLRPGRLMFDLEWPKPKGFSLLYVKREGVEQREGLEVRAGERVKNVQVAYVYGNSVVRGEPAVGVRVNLVRVRTLEGAPVRQVNRFMGTLERTTDDRGVYRTYGLLPGVYVVSAGGRFSMNVYGVIAHTDEAPTFYPSVPRDATTEVTVHAGEEVGAVEIRLRGDKGHAVSGTVAGVTDAAHAEQATIINIIAADSTEYAGQVYIYGRAETEGFSLDGLTDGDYDLVAERYVTTKGWTRIGASSRRVQIRGADVTGLKITFAPLGSLSGRIVFEAPPSPVETKAPAAVAKPTADVKTPNVDEAKPSSTNEAKASGAKDACRGTADALWSGAVVVARREAVAGQTLPASEPSTLEDSPDDKGGFNFRGVVAGTYRFEFKLGEGYFVTGMRRGARPPEASASVVRLGQGEQVSDLIVTAAYGAASVEGCLSFGDCEDCAPARVRVYLVPQERERAEDALRYAEATIERKGREGEFSFGGVAPGRYILVALPEPRRKQGAAELPVFADADALARLRRDAEARGTRITLAPCEHAEGVAVTYAPPEKQNRER